MMKIQMLLLICTIACVSAFSQTFSYLPEKPKAGETITITYVPADNMAEADKPVEAVFYVLGKKDFADDLTLKRDGKKYIGQIKTDPDANFVYFGFSQGGVFDNNSNEGYKIHLYEGDNVKAGSYRSESLFYQYLGERVGLQRNDEKALAAFSKEMESNPADRGKHLTNYVYLISSAKGDEAPQIIQKEIEKFLAEGLKTEQDYITLEQTYRAAKLPEQSKFIYTLRKEKFPEGRWKFSEFLDSYTSQTDPEKAFAMLPRIRDKIQSDSTWAYLSQNMDYYEGVPFRAYRQKKDWDGLSKAMAKATFSSDATKASILNNAAWDMQKDSSQLATAKEFAQFATEYARKEMNNATQAKPGFLTTKQWEKQRKGMFSMYADTYGMVLYRMGDYKKGYALMKNVMELDNREIPGHNNTYALLAQRVLPAKQFQKELEQFIEAGKASGEMVTMLQRVYEKQKGSSEGFDEYLTALKRKSYLAMLEELKKKMINEPAPSFALLDLQGKKVTSDDLKGKVVVVDFWATWCGPCISSFPGMQKAVDKFKDDPNVKFVFIDTWENGENKEKKVSDFISKNKYSFHVLMDNDSKVVEKFKVQGIPTKFVIDKDGTIRFKSVGYDGSEMKLIDELSAMIELASNSTVKAF